jgi:hypothetical protein
MTPRPSRAVSSASGPRPGAVIEIELRLDGLVAGQALGLRTFTEADSRSGEKFEAPIARTLPAFTSVSKASSVSSIGVSASSWWAW